MEKAMTIEEAKQLKSDTEQKIRELILKFQNETKLRVVGLYVPSGIVGGGSTVNLMIAW